MGQGGSKEIESHLHEASAANIPFPNTFELFYESSWKRVNLHLAEDRSRPLYTFDLPKGWYGDMVLYNGPDTDFPPIATAANSGKWQNDNTVTLPPLGPGRQPIQEEMKPRRNGANSAYPFVALVGPGPNKQPEKFEWVSSSSSEVRQLGEYKRGWKLVRVGHESGSEVFAVWADASMSRSKAAKFQFVGRGATGEMGDTWRLMVVVTFARVWQRSMAEAITVGVVS